MAEELAPIVQSDPVAVPQRLEIAEGCVRWDHAVAREVHVPPSALRRFCDLRAEDEVKVFAEEFGPLGLCDKHALPHTHARRLTELVWVQPGRVLGHAGPAGSGHGLSEGFATAQLRSRQDALAGTLGPDGFEPAWVDPEDPDPSVDLCRVRSGRLLAPSAYGGGGPFFQRGPVPGWEEPVEGWVALARALDALLWLRAALDQSIPHPGRAELARQVQRVRSSRWADLRPLVDLAPRLSESFLYSYSGRSVREHDDVAARWTALVRHVNQVPDDDASAPSLGEQLGSARRCIAFVGRRLADIADLSIGVDWHRNHDDTYRSLVGPRTTTLFGVLALQAIVALCPGAGQPGLAICSRCLEWYTPSQHLKANQPNHYCQECREGGAAGQTFRAGGSGRVGKLHKTLEGTVGWALQCNPDAWDVAAARSLGTPPTNWAIPSSFRCNAIDPGDPVYLWVTGRAGRRPTPGLWAAGTVCEPAEGTEDWRADSTAPRRWLKVDMDFLDAPIAREAFRSDDRLANAEMLRPSRHGGPFKLTREEVDAIDAQIAALTPTPPDSSTVTS